MKTNQKSELVEVVVLGAVVITVATAMAFFAPLCYILVVATVVAITGVALMGTVACSLLSTGNVFDLVVGMYILDLMGQFLLCVLQIVVVGACAANGSSD